MFNLMKWSKALKQNQKGFTLVELMVVVVIIGILVAIAIPVYGGIQERAAQNAHDANARTLQGAASIWFAEDPADAGGSDVNTADEAAMGGLATYVNEPYPEVPEIIRGEGSIGNDDIYYSIGIASDGRVTVTPGMGAYDDQ